MCHRSQSKAAPAHRSDQHAFALLEVSCITARGPSRPPADLIAGELAEF